MTEHDLYQAMSPIVRITEGYCDDKLHKGDLCELIDGDDDYYAVIDDLWISMCAVPCEPANPAARDFYRMVGWSLR